LSQRGPSFHKATQQADLSPQDDQSEEFHELSSTDKGKEKALHREHKEIEDPEQRKKVKQRIKNAKSTWKKHPTENATKLQELEDANGTDEELAVVNKYVKNIPHREHKIIEDPKQRKQRQEDIKSIKNTRNNWDKNPEKNATKLQELEDANGTDEELAVVNKYVKKQKYHRERKKIEDPEQRQQRQEDIKSIASTRNNWDKNPEKTQQSYKS